MVYDARDPMMENRHARAEQRLAQHHEIKSTRSDVSLGMGLIILTLLALVIGALIVFVPGSTPVTDDMLDPPAVGTAPAAPPAPVIDGTTPVPAPVPGSSD